MADARKTLLIAALTEPTPSAMRQAMLSARQQGADMVELRLDYLDQVNHDVLGQLLDDRPLPVIVTYRPTRQGGRYAGDETARLAILAQAAAMGAEYIDVEDDVPAAARPAENVILSHHDFSGRPKDLAQIVRRLYDARPAVAKIAFAAAGPADGIAACEILRNAPLPTMAIAMGEHGMLSRVLAGKFGAFGTFASLSAGTESAPGQVSLRQMRELYRWDRLGPATNVYGVIACPVAHSMSPAIHNAAFEATGQDAVYLPLRVEPTEAAFNDFFDAIATNPWMDFRGFSVTVPHKEHALARVGPANVDELARAIGAINTIRIAQGGRLEGFNTDYAAAIDALCAGMKITREGLAGRSVAVLGAGGAARAMVAALAHYGARTTVYNRTLARAEELARQFGCAARPADDIPAMAHEIIINCTSIGMHPRVDDSPAPAGAVARSRVVFDTIYNPIETQLLRQARQAGCLTVSGLEMFVNQAVAQFEIWTHRAAPRDLMRKVVLSRLETR